MTDTPDTPYVSVDEYAARVGKTPRTVWRWLQAKRLPGAHQDESGRWWLPLDAAPDPAPAKAPTRRTDTPDTTPVRADRADRPDTSRDMTVTTTAPPAVGVLGMLGTLEEAAAVLGTTTGGIRRMGRDGLLRVGPWGPNGALRVYAAPKG